LEPDLFEALTWAIIGQQVNLRFACQVKRGMLEHYARRRTVDGQVFYQYPGPADLAGLDADQWRRFKCSRRKAEYIIGLAKTIQKGFDFERLRLLSDEEIIAELVQIRGIGRWTAEYVLIQGFGRWDALPVGDAGLLNGVKKVYGLKGKPQADEVTSLAESWRPYCGLATYYLWWGK
jgi:DNA-3-methyladenine glycosylase II